MKEEKVLFEEISRKLNVIIALLFLKEKEDMNAKKGIAILKRFNLTNQDMADILGITKPTVEVLKSQIKNKNKK